MKQTIEIEVPDGKKAVWKDGTIVFEDIKHKLPKTWEEFCKHNKVMIQQVTGQHLALIQLHQLRDCYRQGWVPDWSNDLAKYCIGRYYKEATHEIEFIIELRATKPAFLSFPTNKLTEEFLTNFRDLIEEAGDLI